MITFTVQGSPIPQPRQRHRVVKTKSGKVFATNYTPAKDPVQSWKSYVRAGAQQAGAKVLTGPVKLTVAFFLPRPASLMRRQDPDFALLHPGARDIDNLYKAVADCLIGICYQDDKQVALLYASKWYHEKDRGPRAEITIENVA